MSSTWIQMPIENAKEVAQRYIRTNVGANYANCTLSYDPDCEVYLTTADFGGFSNDPTVCYVGYIYCGGEPTALESTLGLYLYDNGSASVLMLDASSYAIMTTNFPVIFNGVNPGNKETIFIGYKFNITP